MKKSKESAGAVPEGSVGLAACGHLPGAFLLASRGSSAPDASLGGLPGAGHCPHVVTAVVGWQQWGQCLPAPPLLAHGLLGGHRVVAGDVGRGAACLCVHAGLWFLGGPVAETRNE